MMSLGPHFPNTSRGSGALPVRRSLLSTLMSVLLASCAAPVHLTPSAPAVTRLAAHRVDVSFTTDVPDAYSVTSGPPEAQASFPLNDQLRGLLEEYARNKSNAASESVVSVHVHLVRVRTGYHEIGAPLGRRRRQAPGGLEGNLQAPSEIIKQVELTFAAGIEAGRKQLRKESFRAAAVRTIDRAHFGPWSYDYGDVIEAAAIDAVETIDRLINEALAASGTGRTVP